MRDLFLRGLKSHFDKSDRELLETVAKHIKLGGVFLSSDDDGKPNGFAIVIWPEDALGVPQVAHFYSEGNRAQTRALVAFTVDKIKAKGYNSFIAINGSGVDDEVWKRTFRHPDWEINAVKTVFEFKVKA